MTKKLSVMILLLSALYLFSYNVGDTVGDLSWTDNSGATHSIHELVDNGKVVFFFWGENW